MINRKRVILVIGIGLVLGLAMMVAPKVVVQTVKAQADVPTADFIAAAMKSQIAARGESLQAEYTVRAAVDRTVGEQKRYKYTYVWTPTTVFVKIGYESSDDGSNWVRYATKITSFDVEKVRHRMLRTTTSGTSIGRDHTEAPGDDWCTLDKMETGWRYLVDKPLCEAIKGGTVSEQKEAIDGHDCWRVDVPFGPSAMWHVWCDPALDFCPRRIDVGTGETHPFSLEISEYSQTDGVWFPHKQVLKTVTPDSAYQSVSTLDSMVVRQSVPASKLTVEFPSGTTVMVGDSKHSTRVVTP
ncbi:MAG: hypothetical protein Q7T82_01080 [Armatimonadota bacterium]|nr:hypothetical protein [Armatimonadota bacterium]